MHTLRAVSVSFATALSLGLSAPQARAEEPAHAMGHLGGPPATLPAAPQAELAHRDESLYSLGVSLKDQHSAPIGLDVFRGRPTVVSLFYASCASLCPLLIADIQRFEKALAPADRERLAVVLVSLDPEKDGPASFARTIRMHGVDESRWRLATASAEDVQTLAATLGIRYSRLPEGGFAHSAVITLLSPTGEIAARVEGTLQPVEPLVQAFTAFGRAAGAPP